MGETPRPLELLLGGPWSSSLGRFVLVPPCFFLFISMDAALLSQCHFLPGPSASVLIPLHHTLSTASLLGLKVELYTNHLGLTPLSMEECITGGLVVCRESEKPQEDTVNPSVTLGSGCKC